jgi:hypothetical protein
MISQVSIGEEAVWDFGFRYNLRTMAPEELDVVMLKYETELKRTSEFQVDRSLIIQDILGRIYREVMKRRIITHISKIEENDRKAV